MKEKYLHAIYKLNLLIVSRNENYTLVGVVDEIYLHGSRNLHRVCSRRGDPCDEPVPG